MDEHSIEPQFAPVQAEGTASRARTREAELADSLNAFMHYLSQGAFPPEIEIAHARIRLARSRKGRADA